MLASLLKDLPEFQIFPVYHSVSCEMNEVLPNLFISNYSTAIDQSLLMQNNISRKYMLMFMYKLDIINISEFANEFPEQISYLKIDIFDSPNSNIKQYFTVCNKFIQDARQQEKSVLVHCHAGVSRSATIILAYLITHETKYVIEKSIQNGWIEQEKVERIMNFDKKNVSFLLPKEAPHILADLTTKYLIKVRPCINPNFGFRMQLLSWAQMHCQQIQAFTEHDT